MKKLFAIGLFLISFQFSIFAAASYRVENPQALAVASQTIITDWDFFWGKFISPLDKKTQPDLTVKVPSDWNKYELPEEIKEITKTGKGAGSYRLRLTNLKPKQSYAFPAYRLGYTAFTIYADNKVIFRSGVPSTKWENTQAEQVFDKAVFTADEEGCVTLTIFISNNFYRKGGFRGSFTLYEEKAYTSYHTREICSYSIFSGILLMIVVYCILSSILNKSKVNLFLAFLVLTIYSRIASYLFPLLKAIFPDISFELMLRIEYLSVFFLPGFVTLYCNELNKEIFKHIPAWLIAFPSFIFCILDFTLPIEIANRMVPFMQAYMFTVIGLDSLLFIIRVLRDRDLVSIIAILSFMVLAFGGIGDILSINHFTFLKGGHPIAPSFVLFSIMQILLAAYIQNKNYLRTIELNDFLAETNKAYYRFVPKEFLELLEKKNITEVKTGEYKITRAAILSADIRNFTATSEKLAPIQVFDLLNTYLKRIAPLIRKHKGIIEKYLGDGIIAIFPESSEAAINCALEMQEEMIELREEFAARGMPRIRIGIGIHYGNIIIGTCGNNERMAELALSSDIDIAVKTEAMTKRCFKPVIASAAAIKRAEEEGSGKQALFFEKQELPPNISDDIKQPAFSIFNERIENTL